VHTELWACQDPSSNNRTIVYKERRRRVGNASSISFVRPVCGRTFLDHAGNPLPVQEPIWDSATGRFVVVARRVLVAEFW
jgi:hypothetical protein